MAIPAEVDTLEAVPEEVRELYQETDDGRYRLDVEGVEFESEVKGLKSALEVEREARSKLENRLREIPKGFSTERWQELTEAEKKREEERAKQEGRWEDLREKLQSEHKTELEAKNEAIAALERELSEVYVESALRSELLRHGVRKGLVDAAAALLEKERPRVERRNGKFVGVFPDEVHGPKLIADRVAEWAKTEVAEEFLEPTGGTGGGSGGQPKSGGSAVKTKADLSTVAEKVAYISEHGDEAYINLPDS